MYVLSQDGAPHRIATLSGCALLIFLAQTGSPGSAPRRDRHPSPSPPSLLPAAGRLNFVVRLLAPPPPAPPPPAPPPPAPPPPRGRVEEGPGGEGGGEGGEDLAAAPQAAGGPAEAGGDAAAARAEEEPRGALAAVSGTLLAFFTSLFPGVLPEQPNGAPFAQPQPAGGF